MSMTTGVNNDPDLHEERGDHDDSTIIVNGQPKQVEGREITYDQVVELAFLASVATRTSRSPSPTAMPTSRSTTATWSRVAASTSRRRGLSSMSPGLLDRSPDLQRLYNEGYEVTVTVASHLVLDHVPYVTPGGLVAFGRLVSKLTTDASATVTPVSDHVAYFVGETPCDQQGRPLSKVINASQPVELEAGLTAQHTFSSKPADGTPYADYFAKMTAYVRMLAGHAVALDPGATARTYRVTPDVDPASPFVYPDTASSRAGIVVLTDKLRVA